MSARKLNQKNPQHFLNSQIASSPIGFISEKDKNGTRYELRDKTQNYVVLIVMRKETSGEAAFCIAEFTNTPSQAITAQKKIKKQFIKEYGSHPTVVIAHTHKPFPLLKNVDMYTNSNHLQEVVNTVYEKYMEVLENEAKLHSEKLEKKSDNQQIQNQSQDEEIQTKFEKQLDLADSEQFQEDSSRQRIELENDSELKQERVELENDSVKEIMFEYPQKLIAKRKCASIALIPDYTTNFVEEKQPILYFFRSFDDEKNTKFYTRTTLQTKIHNMELFTPDHYQLLFPEQILNDSGAIEEQYRDERLNNFMNSRKHQSQSAETFAEFMNAKKSNQTEETEDM